MVIALTVHGRCENLPCTLVETEEDRAVEGVFCGDLLSVVISKAQEGFAWVTVIGNANIVAVATLADLSCIVLAEGFSFDEAAIKAAKGKITLLSSDKPVYETAASIGALL
jgi:hypothetical protein